MAGSWRDLGGILARSWPDLGRIFGRILAAGPRRMCPPHLSHQSATSVTLYICESHYTPVSHIESHYTSVSHIESARTVRWGTIPSASARTAVRSCGQVVRTDRPRGQIPPPKNTKKTLKSRRKSCPRKCISKRTQKQADLTRTAGLHPSAGICPPSAGFVQLVGLIFPACRLDFHRLLA